MSANAIDSRTLRVPPSASPAEAKPETATVLRAGRRIRFLFDAVTLHQPQILLSRCRRRRVVAWCHSGLQLPSSLLIGISHRQEEVCVMVSATSPSGWGGTPTRNGPLSRLRPGFLVSPSLDPFAASIGERLALLVSRAVRLFQQGPPPMVGHPHGSPPDEQETNLIAPREEYCTITFEHQSYCFDTTVGLCRTRVPRPMDWIALVRVRVQGSPCTVPLYPLQ